MTLRVELEARGLSPGLSGSLEKFRDLFLKWNTSINLSAASTAADVEEHIVDCLHLLPHLTSTTRLLDVGAGGGFPSVVVAICVPSCRVTALEPTHKKHAFLRTAAREIGLSNLDAQTMRLEQHTQRDYDAAVSRATFDLVDWLHMGLPFVRVGGRVLAFEGVERSDIPLPFERHRYEVAGKPRAIIVVERSS